MPAATAPPPPADELEVSVLGPVRARRGADELALGGRRQRAVLARLALARGRVVAAERLVDELWAGEPPPSATNTLQSYVSNLRRVLGPGATGQPVIERVGDGYRLALEPDALTAARFEGLVTEGGDDARERAQALEEALALWHGPAVGDFSDEPWAQGDAVRLEELRLAATEERFGLLLDLGRHATVVGDLEAAIAAHPLRERLTSQLVLALYRCGRQAEALRAYERTRRHLGEELGLDPSPELMRLADLVLDQDPSLDLPEVEPEAVPDAPSRAAIDADGPAATGAATTTATAAAGPPDPTPEVGPPRGPLDLPPAVAERRARSAFVGREGELAALQAAWAAVAEGDRRLVTLVGEPGMGKTRLAQRFAQWVHDEAEGHVLWGRCTAENLIAYQPAVEALRTALRAVSAERVRSIVEPRPALGLLLPDAAGAAPTGPSRSERYELYEALADLIGTVATSAPLVFVVDDAQWADASTLALVDHLLRSDRSGRLLVVATLRRPAGRPTVELDALLADLRRDLRLDTVEVGGFGAEQVAELLAFQGVTVSADLARQLRDRTAGNPFFVESLAEQGTDLAHADARSLPDSVRDLLDQRLAALDPTATRVLTAAAVIGLRIDLGLLGAVAGLRADELLDVVDEAVASGLLAEDEDLGWVTFPHALVRQGLIGRTTRNREAQLHLAIAGAVADRPDLPHRADSVAQHLLAAGRLCPVDRAARAAVDAATAALGVLADDEARAWARRALDLLPATPATDPALAPLQAEALLVVATSSRNLGDRPAALEAVDRVAALARANGDGLLLARAALESGLSVAGVGFSFGRVDDDLIALLHEALDGLGDGHDAERAALLSFASIARNFGEERDVQLSLAAEALDAAERTGDRPDVKALTLLARRLALAGPQGLDERLVIGPPMVAAAAEAQWPELLVVGRVLSVVDLLEADQYEDARREVDQLARDIAPYGRRAYDAYHLFLEANFALMAGDLDRAEALSARGVELGEPSHAGNAFQAHAAQQYMTARDRGTLGEVAPLVAMMAAEYPSMPVWLTAHAACCTAIGDTEAAQAAYAPIFETGQLENRGDSTWYTTVAQLAEVAWVVGDVDAAATLL
ncbi:MAG TPA: BTAD domain-containing putative transcriptional regulator, partial [Aquihabitans sp.]|nr:BTAD domain-containing putative transcriptional regulator [Aquihabitans sp.]